ncbi:hypothetical protein [Nocardiopsis sp. MG754419]|uniref:hypothetical protein n=1 Tax=Nocardiopsis sp. MG754419 TaxID=2259865 RepID=UPI001BAA722D|nr:hypothetical protein [Nocardiopsis sp. MG754419]MBR8742228.1 hypothetical protein [Nocardiopsis sp. MG754419]
MAVDPSDDHDRLPCGTSPDALLEHLRADAATAHERTCPHCRAAAEEFGPLLAALADRPLVTAPPGLLDDVMRAVRAEGRSVGAVPLGEGASGRTEIRRSAVAAMLRATVRPAGELVLGRCHVERTDDGIVVSATARVLVGVPIPEATGRARRDMTSFVHERLGLRVARIDIDVTDVIESL